MRKMGLLVVAVLVLTFAIGITARAASFRGNDREFSDKRYHLMEEEYISEVRMILLEKGCKNAGITLTYVVDTQGNRNYTITVHHSRLDKMETQELVLLESRLQESAGEILFGKVVLKKL